MNWTRRTFLAGAATAPALRAQRRPAPAPTRPNILLILTDDLPAWALGCYGNTEIRTPNIDTLARAGTRFSNSLVCTPVCSASRATLFTGRTPNQHGVHDFLTPNPVADPPQGQAAPPESFARETMISDLLSAAGYRCGYMGKWHLGNDTRPGHGYQHTYTFDGGSSPYQKPVLYLNGERRQEQGYLADLITQQSLTFLDAQTANQPFFLTVSHFNPHTPYDGHPQKYYDMYANVPFENQGIMQGAPNALREKTMLDDILGNFRKCAASITALDDQIAPLQRKLLEKGFFENTLVIFTSDNGYLMGRHGLWSKGHASHPINMYEEVMQVPMIWSWPGRVPVQAVRPELISFYDFVPTICETAGIAPPEGRCGRSYLPLATSRQMPKGVSWTDLVFGHFRYAWMARDNRFKLVLREDGQGPNELYDLRQDPGEFKNVYGEGSYLTVRERLTGALQRWREKYS
jgi:choline-sulfatase